MSTTFLDYFKLLMFISSTSKPAVASKSVRSFTETFTAGQSSQSAIQGSDWLLNQVTRLIFTWISGCNCRIFP